jgi:predicted nuclease of predicted toxin-antitoxin system
MTEFLADENIPIKAVEELKRKGVNIISILEISPGLSDKEVPNLTNRQGRIVITFDTDFGKLIFKEKLKVRGIILLRIVPKSPQRIAEKVMGLLSSKFPIENCFLVVKEDHVRVIPLRYTSK